MEGTIKAAINTYHWPREWLGGSGCAYYIAHPEMDYVKVIHHAQGADLLVCAESVDSIRKKLGIKTNDPKQFIRAMVSENYCPKYYL